MVMKKNAILLLFLFIILFIPKQMTNKLLFISVDGLVQPHICPVNTPNLYGIHARGVSSFDLQPVFPSNSLPNLHTQATGRMPDGHGIIDDVIKKPSSESNLTADFGIYSREKAWWDMDGKNVPLWTANELHHGANSSASVCWPGSGMTYSNHTILNVYTCSEDTSLEIRLDQTIKFMLVPQHTLVMVYINNVIVKANEQVQGDDDKTIPEIVKDFDKHLGKIVENATRLGFNIIVASTHGTSKFMKVNSTSLETLKTNISQALFTGYGALVGVHSKNCDYDNPLGKCDDEYKEVLSAVSKFGDKSIMVYERKLIPKRFNYNSTRVAPIVLISVDKSVSFYPQNEKKAIHGWLSADNSDMVGVFIADGNSFNKNVSIKTMSNVDIYRVACRVLNIEMHCRFYDGEPKVAAIAVAPPSSRTALIVAWTIITFLIVAGVIAVVVVMWKGSQIKN